MEGVRFLHGLYPIIDTAACNQAGVRPVALAEALAAAGVGIAQFRHKGPFTRQVFDEAEAIGRVLRAAGVKYVINDRADVALMLGADGIHLGQEDLPPTKVRAMVGSSAFIGYSTHNRGQLQAGDQEPVDYLAIGPIFATGSKEKPDPVLGVEALAALRPLTDKPLVAIGGITRENAAAVLAAGADAVAVISDLLTPDERRLAARLEEWLRLTGR
ncbi:MAG: thiamine phosphate synthase [Acidobacteria bacterium]|nr:thiamine phosphate synthase [Acidobacteriota bacterium]